MKIELFAELTVVLQIQVQSALPTLSLINQRRECRKSKKKGTSRQECRGMARDT